MVIENEHEIHFSGITMEKVVERSLQTNGNKITTIACSKEIVERS
jgi:hypothetical protein